MFKGKRVKNSKVINAICLIFQNIYFYLMFYLIVLLFTSVDILVKTIVLIVIVLLLIIRNLNVVNVIVKIFDFIGSTYLIISISLFSVFLGSVVTWCILDIFDYVILNSKYILNVADTKENAAVFLIFIILIWFFISYQIFKISIRFIEKLEIKKVKILVLTKLQYKVLEAGTVFAGFMSLLVSIIVKPEINSIMNNLILGFYLFCLIPFLYFHFNEDNYKEGIQN